MTTQMIDQKVLTAHIDQVLEAGRFEDYGPNGLQVEGKARISKLVSGVTASLALIDAAIAEGADAILVHHGLFWRGQDGRVTGWMRQRLGRLIEHNVNLLAYHLPLDAHSSLGNNAQWGLRLGLTADARFGDQNLGFLGAAPEGMSLQSLADRAQQDARRPVTVLPGDGRAIQRVAWCSGGAQGYFEGAIACTRNRRGLHRLRTPCQ
jgi:dinuclear metal center YbgI/SA1388 family protein